MAPTRDEPKSGQALEVLVLPSECDSGAISKNGFVESGDAKSIIFIERKEVAPPGYEPTPPPHPPLHASSLKHILETITIKLDGK